MENIKIEFTEEQLRGALNKAAEEMFKSSYSNPFKDLLEDEFKQQSGILKQVVTEIMSNALTDEKFKNQVSQAVIQSLIKKALSL